MRGERVVIVKAGQPIAELVPVAKPDIIFGALTGELVIDFDTFAAADHEIDQMWDHTP